MELSKCKNFRLMKFKTNYIVDTLDYFTGNELETQDIFKNIEDLYFKGVLSEEQKKGLMQSIFRYKFYLIDCLVECDELHIRLYDSKAKNYKKSSNLFYKGLET